MSSFPEETSSIVKRRNQRKKETLNADIAIIGNRINWESLVVIVSILNNPSEQEITPIRRCLCARLCVFPCSYVSLSVSVIRFNMGV